MNQPYKTLIQKLTKLYGAFDEENKKFKTAPNSEITRELGYSDAQFSRLINGHATEGEYSRAIQNADRILAIQKYEAEMANLPKSYTRKNVWRFGLPLALLLALAAYYIGAFIKGRSQADEMLSRYDMLRWSFETKYVNPYTKLADLPTDCGFPCYKYQGKWELKQPYKLPFFREQSGFHYVATEAHMYTRCMPEKNPSGDVIEGYEYQKHEIWYDKREFPIDSFLIENDLRPEYRLLDLSKDKHFVKVADVHTFFRNEFFIDSAEIVRQGKVIGRDIEFIPEDVLDRELGNEDLRENVVQQVNRIISNRLEDFSRPISCAPTVPPRPSFHDLMEGDEMGYSCQLTTGRFALNYTKTFVLRSQFIKNKCRPE